jgi:uncharacterized protein
VTLADVNVLISAFRPGAPQHAGARNWLNAVVRSDTRFGLSTLALAAVVRITTTASFFPEPSSLSEAVGFCDGLLGQPNAEIIEPGPRHWSIFTRLSREAGIYGRRTTDAWYAALAIESGCEWITYDRDFARFPGLRWRRPDT